MFQHYQRGLTLHRLRRFEAAREALEAAAELAPATVATIHRSAPSREAAAGALAATAEHMRGVKATLALIATDAGNQPPASPDCD